MLNRLSNKSMLMNWVLWGSLLLSMLASMHHVAASFGYLEARGNEWTGWVAAIAIDAGILTMTYGLRTRRKANRGNWAMLRLVFGVIFLTAISVAANLNAALMVRPDDLSLAIAFSATLPIVVILLSDIASSDDERAAKKTEREERRREMESTESIEYTVDSVDSEKSSSDSIPDYETYIRFCEARNGDGAIPAKELIEKYGVSKSTAYKWYGQYVNRKSSVDSEA